MEHADAAKGYVPPAITVLGSVHGLTQMRGKISGGSDGFLFHGHGITHTSG